MICSLGIVSETPFNSASALLAAIPFFNTLLVYKSVAIGNAGSI